MIALNQICVSFGEKRVLWDFSYSFPEHGVVCLRGPSGCGKTTLARVCSFLQKPDRGTVTGLAPGEVSVLFQENRLLPWYSIRSNLELVMPREKADEWLELVGLFAEADALPGMLSGGMQRRVALARALAFSEKLLILDEPFQGMDAPLREKLYPLVRKQAAVRPVLLITHEQQDADALADEQLILAGPPLVIERIEKKHMDC